MAKPVHTSDTMDKLRGVLSSGPHKGQAIDAALNIVRKKREAGGSANDPTMRNPVGWSSIYPAQIMSNASPSFRPLSDAKLPGAERPLFADEVEGARKYSLRLFEDASNAAGLMGSTGTKAPVMLASARKSGLPLPPYPAGRGAPANVDATPPVRGIRAFHGSPHTFDRFDMSKLGTGEGAQAYGHGLYFAGNEGVARSYRDALTPPGMRVTAPDGGSVIASPGSPQFFEPLVASLKDVPGPAYIKRALARAFSDGAPDLSAATIKNAFGDMALSADDMARAKQTVDQLVVESNPVLSAFKIERPGSMYEVNLRTSPERLLDWDKPLGQQSQGVRDAIGFRGVSVPSIDETAAAMKAARAAGVPARDFPAYQSLQAQNAAAKAASFADIGLPMPALKIPASEFRGSEYLGGILDQHGPAGTSELLKQRGIDGIQYLDQGSRAAGEGSRNYVMFDDKLIDILRRYGLIGMLGGGGAGVVAGETERASGGVVETAMRIVRKKRADGGAVGLHTGPIHSSVAGRTDHLPMHVHSGSYVIPADIVSAMGEGNTMAGFKQINAMFGGDATAPTYAEGGAAKPPVPIVAAGGEYVLSPEQVAKAGDGDVDMGHRVLDEWVKRMRAKTIKTLTKLPGPKKD